MTLPNKLTVARLISAAAFQMLSFSSRSTVIAPRMPLMAIPPLLFAKFSVTL